MPDWNELFRDRRNVLDEPATEAMGLAEELPPGARVLDLGVGGGRHLVPLLRAQARAVGLDIAPVGLRVSAARLKAQGLRGPLVLGDFRRSLPFAANVFDAVLTVKTVNHALPAEIALAFAEITRVLRPGGRLVGTVIAQGDARYGDGREVAPHTFVHDRPPEDGVPHHYFAASELRELLAGYRDVELESIQRTVGPEEPIFGEYRFEAGVEPILKHWVFRGTKQDVLT